MAVETKVKEIIAKRLDIEIQRIQSEAQLISDLGGDSIDLIEIAMDMEAAFGIDISDDDLENIHSIKDVVNFIESRLP